MHKVDKHPLLNSWEHVDTFYCPSNKHRVFVCGDIHADYDIKKLSSKNWKEQKTLTKDDFLICLGDFGLPWSCGMKDDVTEHKVWDDIIMSSNDKYWLDWLAAKNYTTLVVLGNHEGSYNILKYIPSTYYEPINGYVKELKLEKGVIRFLLRDSEYKINDKRFLVIGGALSIDKEHRTPEISWWEEELLTKCEEDNILDIIERGNKFDYVLTHTCPKRLIPDLVYGFSDKIYDPVSNFLDFIENRVEFKEWHFGHFHVDVVRDDNIGDMFQCHYNSPPLELGMSVDGTEEPLTDRQEIMELRDYCMRYDWVDNTTKELTKYYETLQKTVDGLLEIDEQVPHDLSWELDEIGKRI